MSPTFTAEVAPTLAKANVELHDMAILVEREIASVAKAFQDLAGNTDTILKLAGAIVDCVENKNISSVLPKVQSLGGVAKRFIGDRLQATAGILETVESEVKLLRQLASLTGGQEAIALETKALSVFTNVEAARLGSVGAGFQFLARELSDFSKVLTEDTQELATQTEGRRTAIEETRRVLATELPALREKLARVESDLGRDLGVLETRLQELSMTPARFRTGVENTAQQIAGVVAAVQAHDITRQQAEHVMEAFTLIVAMQHDASGNEPGGTLRELPKVYAGLAIQIYQLKTIKDTVGGWTSQIKSCIGGILEVSASELVAIAPMVLGQEREVSSNLAHIELLERQSQAYGQKIQHTLGGLSNLMNLVIEHSKKSKAARDRLRLLSFNSIIEAHRLGSKAGAILAIAKNIKEISAVWSEMARQSGEVMEEIQSLVNKTDQVMEAFSDASNDRLHDAQLQTIDALGNLRSAAAFASQQALEMEVVTEQMKKRSGEGRNVGERLNACSTCIALILEEIEPMKRRLEIDHPHVKTEYDAVEMEKLFGSSYTTEMEREVLHAALRGEPLPVAQQSFEGNSVELF